ncbi:MAG: peptidylprolyl isomerase [Gammaproteobacteria bacterium]|nr:peptidylprolyl isomerase [Gammaproteobacteria bacterium]
MKISKGTVVSIAYLIKDDKENIVEYRDVPLSYFHGGKHELFDQIETALEGKKEDDEVTVNLPWQQAFGPHDPSLTFTDDIENAPPEMRQLGAEMDAESGSGEVLHFVVTQIENGKITIDANHVLAGKDISFLIIVKEVREATAQEKLTLVAAQE